jgi:hypothetical protein
VFVLLVNNILSERIIATDSLVRLFQLFAVLLHLAHSFGEAAPLNSNFDMVFVIQVMILA